MLEERSASLTLIFVVCLILVYCRDWKRIYYYCGMKTVETQTNKILFDPLHVENSISRTVTLVPACFVVQ